MGSEAGPKELRKMYINIISQNTRGFGHEKEEELIECMGRRSVWAACLQETWRTGQNSWENEGYAFIHNGLESKPCARGCQGVAIVLGPEARRAWIKGGCQILYFGTRIVATRLCLEDSLRRPLIIFLVSAYAPDSSRPREEHEDFEVQKQKCYQSVRPREILVEGTDANAAIGVRDRHDDYAGRDHDRVLGPFGIPYVNMAGRALHQILGMNELCVPTSYFNKNAPAGMYAHTTWRHPGRKSPFQLDYFFVKQKDLKRVRDAGVWNHGVDSDHRAIYLKLEIANTFARPNAPRVGRVDRGLLQNTEVRKAWRAEVTENVNLLRGSINHEGTRASALQVLEGAMVTASKKLLMSDGRRRPGWFLAAKSILGPVIENRNRVSSAYCARPTDANKKEIKALRKKVKQAVHKAKQSWMELIVERINGRQSGGDRRPTTPKEIWEAIRELEQGPRTAKKLNPLALRKDQGANGANTLCETPTENSQVMTDYLKQTFSKTGSFDPDAINSVPLRASKPWLDNDFSDIEICRAVRSLSNGKSAGDAQCPAEYFKALVEDVATMDFVRDVLNLYWKSGSFPKGDIPEGPPPPDLSEPTMKLAMKNGWRILFQQANPKKVGSASWDRYEAYKGCTTSAAALALGCRRADLTYDWKHGFLEIFNPANVCDRAEPGPRSDDSEGLKFVEWDVARLVLLPKKGDLSLAKNWRGICLLDVASKIFSSMMVRRMQIVMEEEGMDEQAGFRQFRGTIDGLFAASIGLQKRKEHNLETWALFVDLVKAFDTVPRDALFEILRRFGLPDHFVNVVIRLHANAIIKVKVGEVESELESSIGVRQGSCEGPVLFLFIMQAAMETMNWPVSKPEFRTRADGVTMGERSYRKRGVSTFELWASLFADDCALFFNSRADLEIGTSYLYNHLRRFGLLVHVGSGNTASKTEAMYFPPPRTLYSTADTSRFNVLNSEGSSIGFIDFTEEFKYLGSIIHHSLTSDADVDKRIKAATATFGALKNIFTNKHVDLKLKGQIYNALCLSILLYGCEVWCLREDLLNRLRSFHHRCVRTMCRISIAHTIRHRISSTSLLNRLGIEPIDTYYYRRILRWAGHVARMPMERSVRKLLTGWVANTRPLGCPSMTWGRTLKKSLQKNDLPTDFVKWRALAMDRDQWRALCGSPFRRSTNPLAVSPTQSAWAVLRNGPSK